MSEKESKFILRECLSTYADELKSVPFSFILHCYIAHTCNPPSLTYMKKMVDSEI